MRKSELRKMIREELEDSNVEEYAKLAINEIHKFLANEFKMKCNLTYKDLVKSHTTGKMQDLKVTNSIELNQYPYTVIFKKVQVEDEIVGLVINKHGWFISMRLHYSWQHHSGRNGIGVTCYYDGQRGKWNIS